MSELFLVILGFLFTAFFAGSETAFITSLYRPSEKKYVKKWRESPERFLALTLIGTNISIVLADSIAIEYVIHHFGYLAEIWTTLVVTGIVLIFCEVLPKSTALKTPHIWVKFSAPLLLLFYFVMFPFVIIMTFLAQSITKILSVFGKSNNVEAAYYYEFFRRPVEGLDCGRQAILSALLRFGGKTVHEIAMNVSDVPYTETHEPIESVWQHISDGAQYVIVVENGNVLGVYDRELAGLVQKGTLAGSGSFSRLFIPESKSSELFLFEAANNGFPPAIIVDEHGMPTGVTGGIPMLEKFIKHEKLSSVSFLKSPGTYITLPAYVPVETLENIISEPLPHGQFRTIGGLIEELANDIPKPGQKVEWGDFEFIVLSSDERKIHRVRIVRKEES